MRLLPADIPYLLGLKQMRGRRVKCAGVMTKPGSTSPCVVKSIYRQTPGCGEEKCNVYSRAPGKESRAANAQNNLTP